MVSTERTTRLEEISSVISQMQSQGYEYVGEKKRNLDGTVVLEFKHKGSDSRQILVE